MAAPAFVGAGTVVIIQAGGDIVTAAGSGVAVGDLVILQVLQDGIAAGAVTYSAITGIADLAGTASSLTTLATDQPCGTLAKQHLRVGRATSTTCSVTCTTTANDLYCRIYVFRGVNSGAALTDILENGTAGTVVNGSGTTAAITDTGVTTLGADRLALQFVGVDDDNPLAAFAGATGGTWAEATAHFASATGTDAAIQLQIGAQLVMDNSVLGGSDRSFGDTAARVGVAQSFIAPSTGILPNVQLKLSRAGTPTDLVVEIQTETGSVPSGTVVGTSINAGALPTGGAAVLYPVAAPVVSGTRYWIVLRRTGAADAANYYLWLGTSATPTRTTATYNGSVWTGIGLPSALNYAFFGGMGTAGTIDGGTQTMAAADSWGVLGFALKPVPSGPATLYGATALTVTANRAVAATRKTFAAVAAPLTAGIATAGNVVTPGVTHYGATSTTYALTTTVQARRKTFGQVLAPIAFTKAVQGQRRTTSQIAFPAVFGKAVQATRKTFGAVAAPFVFVKAVQGVASTGAVTRYGATTLALTLTRAVQAQRRTTSSLAAPLTFTKNVQATRRTTSQITSPWTLNRAVQATRRTHGQVLHPTTWIAVTRGTSTTGIQTYYGQITAPYVLARAVQAQRRTFATTRTTITLHATTQAHLMAAILNLADDIRWGTTQPDRVLIGTQEVWTP